MRVIRMLLSVLLGVAETSILFAGASATADVSTETVKIMPLGDSITWGTGSSTGNGYRGPLRSSLATAGYSFDFVGSQINGHMTDPDNEGHRGFRIDQIAANATGSTGWVTTYQPDVVLLHIGTNDMNQNYQLATAPDRLSALIDQILTVASVKRVVVAQLVPSTDATIQSRIAAYNTAIPDLVAKKGSRVRLVDMSTLTNADMYDYLHPDDAGYKKMADRWYAATSDALTSSLYGEVSFRNSATGLCATPYGGGIANGTQLTQWTCIGDASQAWHTTITPSGELVVNDKSGRCLAVYGSSRYDGANLTLWDCSYDNLAQTWKEFPTGIQNAEYLKNTYSLKVVTPNAGSTEIGTRLVQWGYNGSSSQYWGLTLL